MLSVYLVDEEVFYSSYFLYFLLTFFDVLVSVDVLRSENSLKRITWRGRSRMIWYITVFLLFLSLSLCPFTSCIMLLCSSASCSFSLLFSYSITWLRACSLTTRFPNYLKIAHAYKQPPSPPFPLQNKPSTRLLWKNQTYRVWKSKEERLKRKRKGKKFYLFTVHTRFNSIYLSIPFIDQLYSMRKNPPLGI